MVSNNLHLVPVSFREAADFVRTWHRHHRPPTGHKFSTGVALDELLVGVAIVGRPVARRFDDGRTLEVVRTATDGTRNVNSMLYAAAWQATQALGYRRLVTYTHTRVYGPVCVEPCEHQSCSAIRMSESGASLRAAGWRVVAHRPAKPGWDRPSRPRTDRGVDFMPRTLWEAG